MPSYFSQEELNAIIDKGVAPTMAPEVQEAPKSSGGSLTDNEWLTPQDALMAVPRGAVGFGKSVYNLADTLTFDALPDWDTNPLGASKTHIGGVLEGLTEFAIGFIPGLGTAGWAGKAARAGKLGSLAARGASLVAEGGKAASLIQGTAAGAFSSFVSFEGSTGRLSDVLTRSDSPWLNNLVTQYLKTDMDDSELEGRLKNAFEGVVTGAILDATIGIVKGGLRGMRSAEAKVKAGMAPEQAMKEAQAEVGPEIQTAASRLSEAQTASPGARAAQATDWSASQEIKSLEADAADMKPPRTTDADYPIKRGSEPMLDRIQLEVKNGKLDRTDADLMTDFMRRVGYDKFDGMGLRFRKLDGAYGRFEFLRNVVSIATSTGKAGSTFVHELWHAFSRNIDDGVIQSMNKDYQKSVSKFIEETGFDPRKSSSWKKMDEAGIPHSRWYRLTNVDEWVAENLTDATFKRLDLEDASKSAFGFLRLAMHDLLATVKSKLGVSHYDDLVKNWLSGRGEKAMASPGSVRARLNLGQDVGFAESRTAHETAAASMDVSTVMNPSAVQEIRAALAGNADKDALEAVVKDLKDRRLINMEALFKDASGTALDEAERTATIVSLAKTVMANEGRFAPKPKVGNAENQKAALGMIEAMLDSGGANAEEYVRQINRANMTMDEALNALPFVLGMDAQAKRQLMGALARGDDQAVVQSYAHIISMGRQLKGKLGRGLQMVQAFNSYQDIEKWVAKLPPEQLKDLREKNAEILSMLIADPETGKLLASRMAQSGPLGVATELFRNSILSGVKTMSVNFTSGVSSLLLPIEKALGAALARTGSASVRDELNALTGIVEHLNDAYKALKTSWREEGDSITLGRGNTQYGEFQPSRTISSTNPALMGAASRVGVKGTLAETAIDSVGKVVNLPGRILGTSDELFMSLQARSNAGVVLRRRVADELKLPITDPKVVAEADRLRSLLFVDGQLYSRRVIAEKAMREARAQGLKPDSAEWVPFVQRFIDQNWDSHSSEAFMPVGIPSGSMQMFSREDAKILQPAAKEIEDRVRTATWKREYDDIIAQGGPLSRLIGNVGKGTASLVGHVPALQLVVPFIKTPTNLFAFVTDRLPPDAIIGVWKAAKSGDRQALAETSGRLATGTVLLSVAAAAAANGHLTGKGPKDPSLRKQLLDSGWQPYSVKVGDTYVSYGRMDPFASFLGAVADSFDYLRDTYDPTPEEQGAIHKAVSAALYSFANNFTNKSYLRGLVQTLDAVMGDEAAQQRLLRSYAGALVPNVLAQSDVMVNDQIETPRSIGDAILSRIPGANAGVDVFRNGIGEPVKGSETPWSVFLPTTVTQASKDPMRRELADRLIAVGTPSRTIAGGIDLGSYRNQKGQTAFDRLQELVGTEKVGGYTARERLVGLIRSPFYQSLPEAGADGLESPRASFVKGQISLYRRAAMRRLMQEFPDLAQAMSRAQQTKASLLQR